MNLAFTKQLNRHASGKIAHWTILISLFVSLVSGAQTQKNFVVRSTKATIQGTSTLHPWESQVTQLTGKGSFQMSNKLIVAIRGLEIKIKVKSIKSKEGKIMDKKTYAAFHSEKNPYITYAFASAPVTIDAGQQVTIPVSGILNMAGVSKPFEIVAKGKMLANGDVQLEISQKLKMTDFSMVPPKAVLGTIHVGDEITVNFEIVLSGTK